MLMQDAVKGVIHDKKDPIDLTIEKYEDLPNRILFSDDEVQIEYGHEPNVLNCPLCIKYMLTRSDGSRPKAASCNDCPLNTDENQCGIEGSPLSEVNHAIGNGSKEDFDKACERMIAVLKKEK